MYTHQNYTQFCTDIDQCDGVCEGLSWVDCMGGVSPPLSPLSRLLRMLIRCSAYQVQSANSPYAFPTLALSTLHSLPTPVPRSGQKVCKPAWFHFRTQELEASDAVGDVLGWLGKGVAVSGDSDEGMSQVSLGKWTHANVATELGAWLRALERCSGDVRPVGSRLQGGSYVQPPRTHRLFSYLPWSLGTAVGDALGENEGEGDEGDGYEDEEMRLSGGIRGGEEGKGWLEDDDIEDVE